jgi:hypothetical protein
MIKIVSLKSLRDGRINPTFKLSPAAAFFVNDVISGDELSAGEMETAVTGVIGERRSQELFTQLKKNNYPETAWIIFWHGLGFGVLKLTATEKSRIQTLLKKYLDSRLEIMEVEMKELIAQINRLKDQIAA